MHRHSNTWITVSVGMTKFRSQALRILAIKQRSVQNLKNVYPSVYKNTQQGVATRSPNSAEDRTHVIDSAASVHTMSYHALAAGEEKTKQNHHYDCTWLGRAESTAEARGLDILVTATLLAKSQAVLPSSVLCGGMGYSYE